jgi:hypothetical protein
LELQVLYFRYFYIFEKHKMSSISNILFFKFSFACKSKFDG